MDQNNQVDSSTENQSPSGYGTEAMQTPQDTKAAQAERMYGKPDQGVEQPAGATEQKTEAAPESKQESVSQEDASGYLTGETKPTEENKTIRIIFFITMPPNHRRWNSQLLLSGDWEFYLLVYLFIIFYFFKIFFRNDLILEQTFISIVIDF